GDQVCRGTPWAWDSSLPWRLAHQGIKLHHGSRDRVFPGDSSTKVSSSIMDQGTKWPVIQGVDVGLSAWSQGIKGDRRLVNHGNAGTLTTRSTLVSRCLGTMKPGSMMDRPSSRTNRSMKPRCQVSKRPPTT